MNDKNSAIAATDANAVDKGRLIKVSLSDRDPNGVPVLGGETREDSRNNTIYVTIDSGDVAVVEGVDLRTMVPGEYALNLDESAEHEIAGHGNDFVNGVPGNQGGVDAENMYRFRRKESFWRTNHDGRFPKRN